MRQVLQKVKQRFYFKQIYVTSIKQISITPTDSQLYETSFSFIHGALLWAIKTCLCYTRIKVGFPFILFGARYISSCQLLNCLKLEEILHLKKFFPFSDTVTISDSAHFYLEVFCKNAYSSLKDASDLDTPMFLLCGFPQGARLSIYGPSSAVCICNIQEGYQWVKCYYT